MLLMIDPSQQRAPQGPSRVHVPANSAGSIEVLQGQLLKIMCLDDGVVLPFFGFAKDDPEIFLSVHHTRVFSNSYVLGQGMRMVSNRRRPLMVLGQDTVGQHDLLMPASTTDYLKHLKSAAPIGCLDAMSAELDRLQLKLPFIPDPINLFMNVKVHMDGRLEALQCTSKKGDSIVCRVVRDMVFVVATCDTGIDGNRGMGAVELVAAEELNAL